MGISKKPWQGALENICNRIKIEKRIYQNWLHVAEPAQLNRTGVLNKVWKQMDTSINLVKFEQNLYFNNTVPLVNYLFVCFLTP